MLEIILKRQMHKRRVCESIIVQKLLEQVQIEKEAIPIAKIKKTRRSFPRPNYDGSCWGTFMNNSDPVELDDTKSPIGAKFRLRFRVPHSIFKLIVASLDDPKLVRKATNVTGRPSIKLTLKVLGVLGMLGRAVTFDDINELSYISESTQHAFFHRFCEVCYSF